MNRLLTSAICRAVVATLRRTLPTAEEYAHEALARQAGATADTSEPRAERVEYIAAAREIVVYLRSGESRRFSVETLEGLAGLHDDALRDAEVVGHGEGLRWEAADVDLLVPELLAGRLGSQAWMRRLELPSCHGITPKEPPK